MSSWSTQSIPWQKFDRSLVDQGLLRLIKGASLVEYNSEDYVLYLKNIFHEDSEFSEHIGQWGHEERKHGEVLALWAKLVDPEFDFETAFHKFRKVQPIAVDAVSSIRGSLSQELVARCVVETGTATYYSALADATDEPVLKSICKYIAADEIHHYSLFNKTLARYADRESLSRWSRIKTVLERSTEVEDEELTLAFACGNYPEREIRREDYKLYRREFMSLAVRIYQPHHISRASRLMVGAAGLPANGWLARSLGTLMSSAVHLRKATLAQPV